MDGIERMAVSDMDLDTITLTTTETNQCGSESEFIMPSAWSSGLGRFFTIEEYCDEYGLVKEQVKSSKLVAHNAGHMIYNIAFRETLHEQTGLDAEAITDIVKSCIKIPNHYITPPLQTTGETFDRLVYTDVHVNMDTRGSKNTDPLYSHTWFEEDIFNRLSQTIAHVLKFKRSDVIYVDDLGDFQDGLKGETTRGGHSLPQLYSDKKAFNIGIKFKYMLAKELSKIYNKVVFNSVTNDNHSFLFGYFNNIAVKNMVEIEFPNVTYNILEKFLDYYSVGKHTFILTHGKDSGEKKTGFKPVLDKTTMETLDQFCKNRLLYNGNYIEVSKGDSHQRLFDTTTSNDFDYHNYGAMSPPSNWVGTNFKDTESSIDFFTIEFNTKTKTNTPLFFK